MGIRIECEENLHLRQLSECPDDLQEELRDALAWLKKATHSEVEELENEKLTKSSGYGEYLIEVSNEDDSYAALFELRDIKGGGKPVAEILTLGEPSNIRR